ncbi:MAG: hypothetical protein MI861_17280, partial [Pirellulales bacterium]|nr:hypothetical protein [Pirellulales bacterium]
TDVPRDEQVDNEPAPDRENLRDPFAPSKRMRQLLQQSAPPVAGSAGPAAQAKLPSMRIVGFGDNGLHAPVVMLEIEQSVVPIRAGQRLPLSVGVKIHVHDISDTGVLLQVDGLQESLMVR